MARKKLSNNARVIGLYLPQFHPTPENDEWWGKGFTEWTNVAKAKSLFRNHYQPRVPADLGFYDLRLEETREAQAELAAAHGVEAFCYWHYWFAGRRILERPFDEVLKSGRPDFPFCLSWANDTWTGVWHGAKNRILIEQTYPGIDDYTRHFYHLLPAFTDARYVKIHGKPLFGILFPHKIPNLNLLVDTWQELAQKEGLPGIHLMSMADQGERPYDARARGFDSVGVCNQLQIHSYVTYPSFRRLLDEGYRTAGSSGSAAVLKDELYNRMLVKKYNALRHLRAARKEPRYVYEYKDAMRFFLSPLDYNVPRFPALIPGWDHSPRCGGRGVIIHNSTPELFRAHARQVFDSVRGFPDEERIVLIKSWNEWAEGNYMEPDLRYGDAYLRVMRDELCR